MIRAIIIDDEQHCSDRLSSLLREDQSHSLKVEGSFQTVEDGLKAIHALHPDLIFLDLQLQDKTGFDLLRQIHEIDFEIIFTTAYEKYAVQAFKFSAIDYLLKPVDREDLKAAIGRLSDKIHKINASKKIDTLIHNLHGASKRICVPVVTGLVFLQVNDIIRCQSDVNYTTLYLRDRQKLVVAKTLKEFEELLTDYNFFRVHNSHLINLAYIKNYNKGKGGFLTMTDQSIVEVSTRRKEEFMKKLSEL
jgi:two-component system, LytTR family, response regulator